MDKVKKNFPFAAHANMMRVHLHMERYNQNSMNQVVVAAT